MVLNWATELLGLSLRMTEDQLTRDMLAGTATAFNAVGGFNGDNPKMCGVEKSWVIDLESEVAFS